MRQGGEFHAMVSGVGPRDQSLGVKATRLLESALSGQVQGTRERFPVVLPDHIYPAEDTAMTRVLEKTANMPVYTSTALVFEKSIRALVFQFRFV